MATLTATPPVAKQKRPLGAPPVKPMPAPAAPLESRDPADLTGAELDELVQRLMRGEPPSERICREQAKAYATELYNSELDLRTQTEGSPFHARAAERLARVRATKVPVYSAEQRRAWLLQVARLEPAIVARLQVLQEETSRLQGAINRGAGLSVDENDRFQRLITARDLAHQAATWARETRGRLLIELAAAPCGLVRTFTDATADLQGLGALRGDDGGRPAIRGALASGIIERIRVELLQKREKIERALATMSYPELMGFKV